MIGLFGGSIQSRDDRGPSSASGLLVERQLAQCQRGRADQWRGCFAERPSGERLGPTRRVGHEVAAPPPLCDRGIFYYRVYRTLRLTTEARVLIISIFSGIGGSLPYLAAPGCPLGPQLSLSGAGQWPSIRTTTPLTMIASTMATTSSTSAAVPKSSGDGLDIAHNRVPWTLNKP